MTCSTTLISTSKIITACEAYIASVNNRIQLERDKLITREMNKWLFPAKTWDIAVKRLKSGSAFSNYNMIEFSLSWGRNTARDLLLLAKHSDTEYVAVSAEDISVINKFLGEIK